jgi:tol-pal system protein YbgF
VRGRKLPRTQFVSVTRQRLWDPVRQLCPERAILHNSVLVIRFLKLDMGFELRGQTEPTMKKQQFSVFLVLLIILSLGVLPVGGASKEMIQLQTQVQALQDQMTQMQQSFNERMGVMKNLMDQNTDSMNKVTAAITALQVSLEKVQSDGSGRTEQLSGQIQSLNDSVDELKARLAKVSKQLDDLQAGQQNQAAAQATQQAQQQALAQAPPPDVLYNNALRDYNAGKNDLASQEFSDYLKFYPSTDLAGNAYFYLAEINYKQGNFQNAVKNYDQVLQNFPTGNKAPAADLKKGLSLIELGQKEDGIAELKHVVQRYPHSNEAMQARERLRKLAFPAKEGARQ